LNCTNKTTKGVEKQTPFTLFFQDKNRKTERTNLSPLAIAFGFLAATLAGSPPATSEVSRHERSLNQPSLSICLLIFYLCAPDVHD